MSNSSSCFCSDLEQENVLAESRMMIPDCRKRLEAALADLKATVVLNHPCKVKKDFHHLYNLHLADSLTEMLLCQVELEESDQKGGVEIEEAQSTITEVERFFETTGAEA